MPVAAALLLLLIGSPALAQAPGQGCEIRSGSAGSAVRMRVGSGVPCQMAPAPTARTYLVGPPQHGTVTIDRGRATYRSRPEFVGADVFFLRVETATAEATTSSVVTVHVEVR